MMAEDKFSPEQRKEAFSEALKLYEINSDKGMSFGVNKEIPDIAKDAEEILKWIEGK